MPNQHDRDWKTPFRILATMSLILAILSCPLFWVGLWIALGYVPKPVSALLANLPLMGTVSLGMALSAIVAGHMAVAMSRRASRVRGRVWHIRFIIFLGYVNVALIGLVAFAYFNKGRPNADMVACEGNLRQMQTVLREYREANPGRFPPMSPRPGVLMFTPEAIPPERFPNRFSKGLPFTCPTIRSARTLWITPTPDNTESAYDDQSYFYLGYAVFNDDDVEAFAKAYRKRIAEGGTFDDDLIVEDGNGTRVLHRLSDPVLVQYWVTHQEDKLPHVTNPIEAFAPSLEGNQVVAYQTVGVAPTDDVPLLIERDRDHVYTDWGPPAPRGAHVLYAYHGVQFIERGTWPMTEKTQRILAELAELEAP